MEELIFFKTFSLIIWIMSIIGSIVSLIDAYKADNDEDARYYLRKCDYHLIVMWICIFTRWIVYFICL